MEVRNMFSLKLKDSYYFVFQKGLNELLKP